MAVDRPTFSESWHQVEALKPRLRSVVQVHRQDFRGQLWYVLRDPSNNAFFRVDPASYHFVGLLDGKRTVSEAWRLCQDEVGDRAPTQNEAIQLLSQLHQSNLLAGNLPMDTRQMHQRRRRQQQREVGGYLMNLLFARIPLFDPDRFLDRWTPMFGWLFGPVGFALWLGLMATGLFYMAGNVERLWSQTEGVLAPANLLWLYLSFAGIKALHEFGHGIACKHYGHKEQVSGEVHTIGIMLLVLMPVPYVDASSAWAFRSKWRRAIVGAAGMYVELAVAAAAMIVWAQTAGGTLIHNIAYNLIFIASVSTLLFNGNPLLRFDAYYVLSDVLEIPNLNQRGKEYHQYLVKRYGYGVSKPRNPAHSRRERCWLTVYAIASFIYRIIISIGIFLFVAGEFLVIGVVLLAGAFAGWVIMPLGKGIRYLFTSPELTRTRSRAMGVTFGVLGSAVALIALVPVPDYGWAQGVVEPRRAVTVHMGSSGFIKTLHASNARVAAGGPVLASAGNRELRNRLRRLQADKSRLRARHFKARSDEIAVAQQLVERLKALDRRIAHVETRLDALTVEPAFAGTWVAPMADSRHGAFLQRGEKLGRLITRSDLVVRVVADQYLGPRLRRVRTAREAIQIRVDGRPTPTLTARIEEIFPAGQRRLPSAALSQQGGGQFAIERGPQQAAPNAPDQLRAANPFFVVRLDPGSPLGADSPGPALLPGQRVTVRFTLPSKPIAVQVYRAAAQTLQKHLEL